MGRGREGDTTTETDVEGKEEGIWRLYAVSYVTEGWGKDHRTDNTGGMQKLQKIESPFDFFWLLVLLEGEPMQFEAIQFIVICHRILG